MIDQAGDLRVSVVQFEAVPADKVGNLATVRRLAASAAEDGSQLVIFPEMCLVAYWHLTKSTAERLRELAEPANGPLVQALKEIASDLVRGHRCRLPRVGRRRALQFLRRVLPDGTVHIHRKLHAFEHEAISSGDRYTVFDTPWGVRMAILICWDNNLVENVRAVTLLGAKVLIAPHQTGGTSSRSPHGMKVIPSALWHNRFERPEALLEAVNGPDGRGWLMRWLPSRAHDNGIFLLFSNGIGPDDDEIRTGNAMVIDPYGRIIAETPVADEAVVTADLDMDLLPLSTGRRWLLGRRPELYGVLTQRSGLERDARTARHSDVPVPDDFQIGS